MAWLCRAKTVAGTSAYADSHDSHRTRDEVDRQCIASAVLPGAQVSTLPVSISILTDSVFVACRTSRTVHAVAFAATRCVGQRTGDCRLYCMMCFRVIIILWRGVLALRALCWALIYCSKWSGDHHETTRLSAKKIRTTAFLRAERC